MQQPLSSYTQLLLRDLQGEILAWERKFCDEHRRKPAKRDIDQEGMSKAYIKYQRLKRLITTPRVRAVSPLLARRKSFGFVPELGASSSFYFQADDPKLSRNDNDVTSPASDKMRAEKTPSAPDRRRIEIDSRVLRCLDNIQTEETIDSFVPPGANKKSSLQLFHSNGPNSTQLAAAYNVAELAELKDKEIEVPETESDMEPAPIKSSEAGSDKMNCSDELDDSQFTKEFWEVASNPLSTSALKKKKRVVNVGHRQAVNLKRRRYTRKRAPASQPLAARPALQRRWSLGGATKARRIEVLKRFKKESDDRNAHLYCETLSLEELEVRINY